MNINGYDLSRAWFNFCFENPEQINSNHTALYFFCIEHCNRLGWKKKFGLPTTMAKEAIGIRSYNTYIKTLNQLIDFGFIKLIEKSKNQYSSNIIALSNIDKAPDKALDKALIKHSLKQEESTVQSIDSIIKQLNKEQLTSEQLTILEGIVINGKLKLSDSDTWRYSFGIYLKELSEKHLELIKDEEFISLQEKYNPNVDIVLSIEKAINNFWGTEAGWKNKKSKRTKVINWKSTLTKAIDMNKVYKQRDNGNNKQKRGNDHDFNIITDDQ